MTITTIADRKDTYSNYIEQGLRCREERIPAFEDMDDVRWRYGDARNRASFDTGGPRQGAGCLRLEALESGWVDAVTTVPGAFRIDASDKKHTFLKLWVYVEDIALLAADKADDEYDDQGTVFIDINSGTGHHQWNHTFRGSGWHELELSFCNHNNYPADLSAVDYSALNNLWVRYVARAGLVMKFADLRTVSYSSDYALRPAPFHGRLISNCDYDEFSGIVLGEWYGASFDLSDRKEGSSCLSVTGNGRSSEYRIYIGDLDIPMDVERDVLCFWLYISDIDLTGRRYWNLELNEVQDIHEYSCDFDGIAAGCEGIQNGWNRIRIPLRHMEAQLDPAYGDTITLHAFRLTAGGTSDTENYVLKIDQVYLARESDLEEGQ